MFAFWHFRLSGLWGLLLEALIGGYVAWRSGSIYASILAHFGLNATSAANLLLQTLMTGQITLSQAGYTKVQIDQVLASRFRITNQAGDRVGEMNCKITPQGSNIPLDCAGNVRAYEAPTRTGDIQLKPQVVTSIQAPFARMRWWDEQAEKSHPALLNEVLQLYQSEPLDLPAGQFQAHKARLGGQSAWYANDHAGPARFDDGKLIYELEK